jgi:hypothetical protein
MLLEVLLVLLDHLVSPLLLFFLGSSQLLTLLSELPTLGLMLRLTYLQLFYLRFVALDQLVHLNLMLLLHYKQSNENKRILTLRCDHLIVGLARVLNENHVYLPYAHGVAILILVLLKVVCDCPQQLIETHGVDEERLVETVYLRLWNA